MADALQPPAPAMTTERPRKSIVSFAAFIALGYGVAWAVWMPLVLAARGGSAAWPYLHLIGGLAPAVGGAMAARIEGPDAWNALIARLDPRRSRATWLLIAVLAPVALYFLAIAPLWLAGQGWPTWKDFGASREYAELGRAGYWAANVLFYGYGEEIGWRGYLLPRLQRRHTALVSALVVGVVWALWHLPLFWFAAGMRAMGPAEIAGWFFSIVTGSILMTWLFNASGGSLTAVAFFHGVLDIVMGSPGPAATSSIMGAALIVWGIAVVFLGGPVNLARRSRQTS